MPTRNSMIKVVLAVAVLGLYGQGASALTHQDCIDRFKGDNAKLTQCHKEAAAARPAPLPPPKPLPAPVPAPVPPKPTPPSIQPMPKPAPAPLPPPVAPRPVPVPQPIPMPPQPAPGPKPVPVPPKPAANAAIGLPPAQNTNLSQAGSTMPVAPPKAGGGVALPVATLKASLPATKLSDKESVTVAVSGGAPPYSIKATPATAVIIENLKVTAKSVGAASIAVAISVYDKNGASVSAGSLQIASTFGTSQITPPMASLVANGTGHFADPEYAKQKFNGENKEHTGVDYMAKKDTIVKAICDGKVVKSATGGDIWDAVLIVEHTCPAPLNKVNGIYGHITASVKLGDIVKGGSTIGSVRDWPLSNGRNNSHLHFGLKTSSITEGWGRAPLVKKGEDAKSLLMSKGWLDPEQYLK